jgi:fatty acid desaturase
MFLGFVQTFQFLFKRKMSRFYVPLTWSEVGYFLFCMVMLFINFKATMAVFVVPFLFARLVMMLGNWAQHSFVDPELPDDEFASTVICINTKYNHKCWNDGYHAFHHARQAAHYTEYPIMFEKHLDELVEKKAFVFHGIHFLHIFLWLMTKRYDKLAKHIVNIDGCFKSEEEVINLMRIRTMKFDLANFGERPINHRVEKLVAA